MVAVVLDVTFEVVTLKVILVFPAGIVTDVGGVATEFELDSEMTRPVEGAADPMVTVPVTVLLPSVVVGLSFSDVRMGGFTVSGALSRTPLRFPLMSASP